MVDTRPNSERDPTSGRCGCNGTLGRGGRVGRGGTTGRGVRGRGNEGAAKGTTTTVATTIPPL
ncbi:hypothetical protein E2C01_069527 [Portunus trituberculatus]|uniref:Uncharacterized protein n=1 Tax=Portunus trituberculatus TaxID=210409 RepID=A0A5B7HYS4_PORTR|nr:hypothetical protein [Portunus trituberculatus]